MTLRHDHDSDPSGLSSSTITVVTADKQKFEVPVRSLRSSNLFNAMLASSDLDKTAEFELREVSSAIFVKVLEWCRHHEDHPPVNVEVDPHTRERHWFVFSDFHRDYFMSLSMETLEDLIMTADYLQIQSLYLYSCQAAAARLEGKSPEEIRSLLGLPDDLTEEEKESIRRDNVWCSHR